MQLDGTGRLLQEKQHRFQKGKIPLPREGLLVNPMLMTKGLLSDQSACLCDAFINPIERLRVLHPKGNATVYLLCTYNYASTYYEKFNLMAVTLALPGTHFQTPSHPFRLVL